MCSKLYADGELAATPYEAEQKTCDEGASNAD